MLDLEIPTEWTEETNIQRNQMRLALHLNIAQCALKCGRWDEAVHHTTFALKTQPGSVKALYRRALAHFSKPVHANGLQFALEDLSRAAELEPQNKEVAKLLVEVRQAQKKLDRAQSSMYSKMLAGA